MTQTKVKSFEFFANPHVVRVTFADDQVCSFNWDSLRKQNPTLAALAEDAAEAKAPEAVTVIETATNVFQLRCVTHAGKAVLWRGANAAFLQAQVENYFTRHAALEGAQQLAQAMGRMKNWGQLKVLAGAAESAK